MSADPSHPTVYFKAIEWLAVPTTHDVYLTIGQF